MDELSVNGLTHPDDPIRIPFTQEYQTALDRRMILNKYLESNPEKRELLNRLARQLDLLQGGLPRSTNSTSRLKIDQVFDGFRIVHFLKSGGMGDIYIAEQIGLKRKVVIKVIGAKQDADARIRFEREKLALAKMHETNIVPIFADGRVGDCDYFAMPYIYGISLEKVILQTQALISTIKQKKTDSSLTSVVKQLVQSIHPQSGEFQIVNISTLKDQEPIQQDPNYLRDVTQLMATIAESLSYAHAQGIFHRDIKPANLMVELSGEHTKTVKCWLIDFGLVSDFLNENDTSIQQRSPLLTRSSMGTPAYMAPEQFVPTGDARLWDVWGLGVTFYELLTLRRAFCGDRLAEQIKNQSPIPPNQLVTNLPKDLEAICRKAMRRNPAERYQSMSDFANDLRGFLNNELPTVRPGWIMRPLEKEASFGIRLGDRLSTLCRRAFRFVLRNKAWSCFMFLFFAATFAIAAMERQRAKEVDRQLAILEVQRIRLTEHEAGWFQRVWTRISKLAEDRQDPLLKQQAYASLAGFDVETIREVHNSTATWLAYDATGEKLLIAGYIDLVEKPELPTRNRPTRLLNLRTDTEIVSTQSHPGPVVFRGDIPIQVIPPTLDHPVIRLWNVQTNQPVEEFSLPKGVVVANPNMGKATHQSHIAISPDSQLLALTVKKADTSSVLIWKNGNPQPLLEIPFAASVFAFTPDNLFLAMGNDSGKVVIWDLSQNKQLESYTLERVPITGLGFGKNRLLRREPVNHPAKDWYLAVGNQIGICRILDFGRRTIQQLDHSQQHEVLALTFSLDGTLLVTAGRFYTTIWDVASGKKLVKCPTGEWNPAVVFSPKNQDIAVSVSPLFIWKDFQRFSGLYQFRIQQGRGIQSYYGLSGHLAHIRLSAKDTYVAAISDAFQVAVWERQSGRLMVLLEGPDAMYADHVDVQFSADEKQLLIAGGKEAQLWDLPQNPKEEAKLRGRWDLVPAFSTKIAFHPEAGMLICRTEMKHTTAGYPHSGFPTKEFPRVVRIWQLLEKGTEKRLVGEITDYPTRVVEIQASPDGTRFLINGRKTQSEESHGFSVHESRTGNKLWHQDDPNFGNASVASFDSTGSYVGYCLKQQLVLTTAHDGKIIRTEPRELRLGYKDLYFLENQKEHPIWKKGDQQPFFILDADNPLNARPVQWNRIGTHLAYANHNATVLILDFSKARETLSTIRLGW